MKAKVLLAVAAVSLLCTGCWTRIVTVSPSAQTSVTSTPVSTIPVYTTTTTVRPSRNNSYVVTTAQVSSVYSDWCFGLDLQAVAAAFCEARSIQEFEMILNSSSYMISNLDLNRDGYIDYLRVLEVLRSNTHVLVVQACLGYNQFQDVATVVAECGNGYVNYVQVIGDSYIYGANYIVQPVIVRVPPMYAHTHYSGYTCWNSPYYWDHYPSHYGKPAPVQHSHYNAYVNSYMKNHKYVNQVNYPSTVHYTQYEDVRHPVSRTDYSTAHPDQSFASRNASVTYTSGNIANASARTAVSNASDLRRVASAAETTTTTSRGTASSGTSRTNTSASSTSGSRTNTSTTSSTSGSRSNTSTTTSSSTSGTRTNTTTTTDRTSTTDSRTNTTKSDPSSSSTTSGTRTNTTTSSSSSTRQQSSTVNTSNTAVRGTASSSGSRTNTSSVTTTTRVNTSGSSSTRTTTTTPSGSSTVKRGSASSTQVRSSSSTSGATRSSSSTTTPSRSSSSTGSSTRR